MTRHAALCATLLLLGCATTDAGEPVAETIAVFHHPVECVGFVVQGCLLAKIDAEPDYGALFDGIQGFAYEWGFTYELEVDRFQIDNPPADGPSVRRVLRRLVRKTRVPAGTEFEMVLTGDGPVQALGGGQYQWFNSPRFDCPPGTDCAALATALGQGRRVRFRFAHPAAAANPLQVVAWQVCPNQGIGAPCDG
jgi:hypothetical protein